MELFWKTIADYNAATWWIQVALTAVGAVLVGVMYTRPNALAIVALKIFMAVVCFYLAAVYYGIFCRPREYSGAFAVFWIITGLVWAFDAFSKRIAVDAPKGGNPLAWILLTAPLAYPLLSVFFGRGFPEMTSPIMPCSVVVFSIGLMLEFEKRINLILAMLLLHWSILSIPKTALYSIPEDYLLALSSIPAVYLVLKNYISQIAVSPTKPSARFLEVSLFVLCAVLGLFFTGFVLSGFGLI